jgi:hypothetical protein
VTNKQNSGAERQKLTFMSHIHVILVARIATKIHVILVARIATKALQCGPASFSVLFVNKKLT